MNSAPNAPRDRRGKHRAEIDIPATVQLGEEEFTCSLRDLSAQGLALCHDGGAKIGSVLRVVFRLPNSRQPIEVAGVLVRTEPQAAQGTWALRLIDPSAQAIQAIETFVSRHRSDLPFSQKADSPSGAHAGRLSAPSATTTRLDNTLKGLYDEAIDDANGRPAKKRWFHRRTKRET